MPESVAPALRRFLAAWTALGVLALLLSGWLAAVQVPDVATLRPLLLPLLAVATVTVVADRLQVVLPVGRSAFAVHVLEVAVVLGLVLLPAALVAPAVVAGQALGHATRRIAVHKAAFNLAVSAVAASLAALVTVGLTDVPVEAATPRGVVALTLAGTVYGVVNGGAMGLLMRTLARSTPGAQQPSWRAMSTEAAALLAMSVPLAVIAAVVLATVPVALPLLALLLWTVHRALDQGLGRTARQEAEHHRLERSVAGAADGIVLLDREGRIELGNPAAADLLGTAPGTLAERSLEQVLQAGTDAAGAAVDLLLGRGDADRDEGDTQFAYGQRILRAESSVIRDHRAAVSGWVVMLSDITEAHELDALRREFVARVSHELRTPLTAILGITQTLQGRGEQLDAVRRAQLVAMAERQSRRLQRLVDDLLWSARIDANPPAAVPEAVGLRGCVDNVASLLVDLLPDGFEADVDGIVARADPGHLEQILTNLLINAVRYGKPPIQIRAVARRGTVSIEVCDHGPGVPAEFEPELFASFTQASIGDRRESQGLGLGLSIVASLSAANGGSVRYHRREGRTCFEVTLPAADASDAILQP